MVRLPTELPPQHAAFDELTRQLATLGRFLQRLAPASCVVHRTDLAKHMIEDTGKASYRRSRCARTREDAEHGQRERGEAQ